MRIALEMFNADKRRRKREVVRQYPIVSGVELGEHDTLAQLQQCRRRADAATHELVKATQTCEHAQAELQTARRDLRRVSER